MLLYYWIYQTRWGKPIRCSAKPRILSFSPTRLINSIIREHSYKILYIGQGVLLYKWKVIAILIATADLAKKTLQHQTISDTRDVERLFSQIQNTAITVLLCSSPVRVFSHLLTAWVCATHNTLFFILICSKMFLFLKYEPRQDKTNKMSVRPWAHSHIVGFVMSRLISSPVCTSF